MHCRMIACLLAVIFSWPIAQEARAQKLVLVAGGGTGTDGVAATDAKQHVPAIPFIPFKQLYLITCIDPRVEPASFHPEAGGRILVHVHQVVRDLAEAVLADGHVGHRFTIEFGLIRSMEVCPLPSPDQGS